MMNSIFVINPKKLQNNAILIALVLKFSIQHSFSQENSGSEIIFPTGIAVNVGQVGWMGGSSLEEDDGPWRAGIRREFDVRDYNQFVEIGNKLGIRFMCLFILGEFDRLNILAKYPNSNPYGNNWDNSKYVTRNQFEIMDYIKNNAHHIELGITGVLHEFWEDGDKSRAEWFNVEEQKPRSKHHVQNNIKIIKNILSQYDISEEEGHSFPESFISYGFYFNPDDKNSMGKILSDHGVKYANTPFATIHGLNHPPLYGGGFDHGLLLLDRHNHGNLWYEYASLPKYDIDSIKTIVVESHWANWLAYDDHLQNELNEKWLNYLTSIQRHRDFYLAKNTEQLYSQWIYKEHTLVKEIYPGEVEINNNNMPNDAYENDILGNMVLSIKLNPGEHITYATLNGEIIPAYYETEGFGYLYLPKLDKKEYILEYSTGGELIRNTVYNTGTYNVYRIETEDESMVIDLKIYGVQTVEIYCDNPRSIVSHNQYVSIIDSDYKNGVLYLTLSGKNIQGERGLLEFHF